MTPADRFNEVALLVMGPALAGPVCISPLLLLLSLSLPPRFLLFLQSRPPGPPSRGVRVYCCLFPSGNYCFVARFCDEGFCLPSFISPHCNLNLFVFGRPSSASRTNPSCVPASLSRSLTVRFFSDCFFVVALCFGIFPPPLPSVPPRLLQYMRQQSSD